MITCKICGEEKPDDQFYFFQNADGVPRRRHRCKICISKREGARYWKKKGVVIPTVETPKRGRPYVCNEENPTGEVKECSKCGQTKPITHFYIMNKRNGRRQRRCKICYNESSRPDIKGVWENLDYRTNPGEWISEEQKDVVHKILYAIGWSYNAGANLWYKIPKQKDIIYKDKDGKWHNINGRKFRQRPKNSGRKKINLDMEEVFRLSREGMSYKKIAEHFNISYNTIKNKILEYNLRH